jgi:hypothetical protein
MVYVFYLIEITIVKLVIHGAHVFFHEPHFVFIDSPYGSYKGK